MRLPLLTLLASFGLALPALAQPQTQPEGGPVVGALLSAFTQEYNQADFYEREKAMLEEKVINGTATNFEVQTYYFLLQNLTGTQGDNGQ